MNSRAALVAGLFASVMATVSCGDNLFSPPVAPTGPSSLSGLLQPRLTGNWGGDFRLDSVAGGMGSAKTAGLPECTGVSFDRVVGERNDNTLSITQSGSDLTARLTSAGTGLACEYTGSVGSGNSFVLHAESCTQEDLVIMCTNGDTRVMQLVGSSITATFDDRINPKSISGTAAQSYNVLDASRRPVNGLVANQSFPSLTRR
jgi:hypothetical protein